jgi:hypothetical protein
MKNIIGLAVVAAIFVIGLPFAAMIMGAVDAGTDMTDSEYEEMYDLATDTSTDTLGILAILPIIIGMVALIVAIGMLKSNIT